MKMFRTIFVVAIATSLMNAGLVAQPVTPGYDAPCPCSALYAGYYFTGNYYPTKPVLFSNMTLDEFVGYVIMDSIITHAKDSFPSFMEQENFIKSLTCSGDTLRWAMRYLYRMADENPFLYYNFLTSYQKGKQQPMSILPTLLTHIGKQCGLPTQEVMKAEYILHLRVNGTERTKEPDEDNPWDSTTIRYVYTKVLDKIKGQVLPNPNGAVDVSVTYIPDIATLQRPKWNEPMPPFVTVKKARNWIIPAVTDFVYYYLPGMLKNGKLEEVSREYIVFSFIQGACINAESGSQYYVIRPTLLDASDGIFPIYDGNVYDMKNTFGWGTYVPVATFKQNLRNLINSIKNYGD